MLKQSVYFRVPNDIADLIGIEPQAEVTLSLEDQSDRFLLIYSVKKPHVLGEQNSSQRAEQLLAVSGA
jgi:hypothetical protein